VSEVVELRTKTKTKGGKGGVKRVNFHKMKFAGLHEELLESPVLHALSANEFRAFLLINKILSVDVGGNIFKNGELVITHERFIAAGVQRNSVAPSLRALEALGLITVVWGDAGAEGYRKSNLFGLTSFPAGTRNVAECRWRLFDDASMAKKVAKAARVSRRFDHKSWLRARRMSEKAA
jgi:hypothetical protein